MDPIEVTLPSADGSSTAITTTLTPSAIFWGIDAQPEGVPGGHAFGIIQENGNWYEMNNASVFPIPKEWEKDIPLFIGRYPKEARTTYTTSNSFVYRVSVRKAIAVPSFFKALELHTEMLGICSVSPSTVDFFCNYTFYWWLFIKSIQIFVLI